MAKFSIRIPESSERRCTVFDRFDTKVPSALWEQPSRRPDMSAFPLPLPSRPEDYTCSLDDGRAVWYGAKTGLTRYEENARWPEDVVMYFSAPRDLEDNYVETLMTDGHGGVWALTKNGVSHIEMVRTSAFKKAETLRQETIDIVDRRGMVSQRNLTVPRILESKIPFNHSDNDGSFTTAFSIGEILRYATFKREWGADDERTKAAFTSAVRYCEASLLLMYICGRGDGFVARTYLTVDEPVPEDGIFFKKGDNGKAVCLNTFSARRRGMTGFEADCSAPVPDRLARLYRERGYRDSDIVYKADTSSDEITMHFLHLYFAHKFLGAEDGELDSIIKDAASNTLGHILKHGGQLRDCRDEATTWAKWDEKYFRMAIGWPDACLNSAELLSYIRITMDVTGDTARWRPEYDKYIRKGYADLPALHRERFMMNCVLKDIEEREDIMYGDHMLATAAHWALCMLEDDPKLLAKYRAGLRSWRFSIAQEHNPGYDFPYVLACPDAADEIDREKLITWFRRTNLSFFAAPTSSSSRLDIPRHCERGGVMELSCLLTPDERSITKYDTDPFDAEKHGDLFTVESCYTYTFAYWIGRYYGLIV